MKNRILSLLAATAVVVLAGASPSAVMASAHEQPGGTVSAAATRSATVTRIDKKERWVTLKLADGSIIDVQAGPAVRNFDQIKVGDQVVASKAATVTIEVVPPGQAVPDATGGLSVTSAPKGARPMAVEVETVVVSGAVTDINYGQRLLTLVGPDGIPRTFEVGPEAQTFNAVKKGDVVVVTAKTATALEVKSPGR